MNPIIFDQFKHPQFNGSYYHASSNSSPIFPKLIGEEKTDICIIGGGLTGISSALNLAETGQAVTLVEGMRIGSGASGRNGGQIVQGYSCDIETMIKTVGKKGFLGLVFYSAVAGAQIAPSANQAFDGL